MQLAHYLEKHQITSAEFAERVGVSLSAIQKYRIAHRFPRPHVIKRIEKITRGKVALKDWYSNYHTYMVDGEKPK